MPFDFLKRNKSEPAKAAAPGSPVRRSGSPAPTGGAHRGIAFEGLTEEWRLVGWMEVPGRLSDALNKREPITIDDVQWAPFDGSGELASAPGPQDDRSVRPDHRARRRRTRCRR